MTENNQDERSSQNQIAEEVHRRFSLTYVAMLAVGPLVALIMTCIEQNPRYALPILAFWSILWFIGTLAADSAARVREKPRSRFVDRAADRLDLWSGDLRAGHRHRYLNDVIFQHRNFDVKGLSTQAAFTLELVY